MFKARFLPLWILCAALFFQSFECSAAKKPKPIPQVPGWALEQSPPTSELPKVDVRPPSVAEELKAIQGVASQISQIESELKAQRFANALSLSRSAFLTLRQRAGIDRFGPRVFVVGGILKGANPTFSADGNSDTSFPIQVGGKVTLESGFRNQLNGNFPLLFLVLKRVGLVYAKSLSEVIRSKSEAKSLLPSDIQYLKNLFLDLYSIRTLVFDNTTGSGYTPRMTMIFDSALASRHTFSEAEKESPITIEDANRDILVFAISIPELKWTESLFLQDLSAHRAVYMSEIERVSKWEPDPSVSSTLAREKSPVLADPTELDPELVKVEDLIEKGSFAQAKTLASGIVSRIRDTIRLDQPVLDDTIVKQFAVNQPLNSVEFALRHKIQAQILATRGGQSAKTGGSVFVQYLNAYKRAKFLMVKGHVEGIKAKGGSFLQQDIKFVQSELFEARCIPVYLGMTTNPLVRITFDDEFIDEIQQFEFNRELDDLLISLGPTGSGIVNRDDLKNKLVEFKNVYRSRYQK